MDDLINKRVKGHLNNRANEGVKEGTKDSLHSSASNDDVMKKLYAARKRKFDEEINVDPLARRNILKHAKEAAATKHDFSSQLTRWFHISKGVLATSAVALLIGLIVWNQKYQQTDNSKFEQYAQIEVHQMLTEQASTRDILRRDYDTAYKAFLKQQQLFAFHHRDGAKLNVSDNSWVMTTCAERLIKISPDLLAMLSDLNRVDLQLVSGDTVDILYAFDGRIMNISKSSALIC